jgi:hypothetical protein
MSVLSHSRRTFTGSIALYLDTFWKVYLHRRRLVLNGTGLDWFILTFGFQVFNQRSIAVKPIYLVLGHRIHHIF